MSARLGQVSDCGKCESLLVCMTRIVSTRVSCRVVGAGADTALTIDIWSCMVLPWHGTRSRPPCTSHAEQNEQLKLLHHKTKVPVAEYIRQGIDLVLEREKGHLPGQLTLDVIRK
jgi:hypothetical protein